MYEAIAVKQLSLAVPLHAGNAEPQQYVIPFAAPRAGSILKLSVMQSDFLDDPAPTSKEFDLTILSGDPYENPTIFPMRADDYFVLEKLNIVGAAAMQMQLNEVMYGTPNHLGSVLNNLLYAVVTITDADPVAAWTLLLRFEIAVARSA